MKMLLKNLGITTLSLGMITFCLPQFSVHAKASDVKLEIEDNSTKFTATSLESNNTTIGLISSKQDIDYYKYVVDQSGYFSFQFENVSGSSNVGYGWTWHIYDESLNELWSNSVTTSSTSYTYDFEVGTVLYLMVESTYHFDSVDNMFYTLTVSASKDSSWEQEQNGSKNTATNLKSNQKLYGNIYQKDDSDYYKYVVDVTGYFNFTFENESETNGSGSGWNLTVYDSSLNELESITGISTKKVSKTYNFKKDTVLYIKIESTYHYADVNGITYSLLAEAKNSSKWEWEGFDSFSKIISIKHKSKIHGTSHSANDKDCYKYKATKKSNAKVTFDFDSDDVGYGWDITIYNSSKQEIKTLNGVTSKKTISWNTSKGSTYYIVIQPSYANSIPEDVTYTLKVK